MGTSLKRLHEVIQEYSLCNALWWFLRTLMSGFVSGFYLVVSLHSPHLAKLRRGGLLKTCRDSQAIYYSLSSHEAALLIECLHGEFLLIQSYTLKKAHNRHTGPVLAELAWQTYQKIK